MANPPCVSTILPHLHVVLLYSCFALRFAAPCFPFSYIHIVPVSHRPCPYRMLPYTTRTIHSLTLSQTLLHAVYNSEHHRIHVI
ncbi:hypothetical protein B0H16DRAFT_154042 [Mycena metata]|uniref:Uncharacterized protein n=1 Tax=Mycena metata TaxID=1033252 RepID=A0AAD7I3B8_9AGAR|nr:hypothetical protein B0H16DRAFT_154042 [Mycena metata]